MAASYPTSVKVFTTKSTADVVQAAHVNDLQDEVNAIEAGLLNGTAPLNSSNSTVANLSVTGGSTFGSLTLSSGLSVNSLQVSSGSTFAARAIFSSGISVTGNSTVGALTAGASTLASLSVSGASTVGTFMAGASTLASVEVTGGSTLATLNVSGASTFASRPIMPAPPALRVELGSSVTLNSTATVLNWLGPYAWASSATQHSTATNSSRFTPDSTGLWSLFASLEVSENSTAPALTMSIIDSSAGLVGRTAIIGVQSGGTTFSVFGTKRFDATGGWLAVSANQARASTLSAVVTTNMSFVQFWKL